MITFNNDNAETSEDTEVLAKYTAQLQAIRASGAYTAPESSINLGGDKALLGQVQKLADKKRTQGLRYSVVVGIGGSNLGTKAIYDALLGYRDTVEPSRYPKMLFAETTDSEWLTAATRLVGQLTSKDEVLVTVISKSGGTTETLANFEIIVQALEQKFGSVDDRIIVITDEGSKLWQAASDKGLDCLALPAIVGGRYSVFSSVGLFPLASIGIDIAALQHGAHQVLDHCFSIDNIAARSAQTLAQQYQKGRTINDNFFFHPELESLGKWYRQLMGESIGKEQDKTGAIVHVGITPTVSLGSTDLHSVGQLYLGGPQDKLTTFVSAGKAPACMVPTERYFPELVPMITGKSAETIMQAILEGVKAAYRKASLPYMEVRLDAIDEASLGAYMQWKMLEMMYLGTLLNVNSFDQPNVEAYKTETKQILEK